MTIIETIFRSAEKIILQKPVSQVRQEIVSRVEEEGYSLVGFSEERVVLQTDQPGISIDLLMSPENDSRTALSIQVRKNMKDRAPLELDVAGKHVKGIRRLINGR